MGIVKIKRFLCILEIKSMADASLQIYLSLFNQIDHSLESAILQAAASYIQLLRGDDKLVDIIRIHTKAHGDHSSGISGTAAGSQEASLKAGCIDHYGRSITICDFMDSLYQILGTAVYNISSTML